MPLFNTLGLTCKTGDGVGGSEKKLSGSYTTQECIDAVRLHFPNANGITRSQPCPNKCKCYAEFGMTGWNSKRKWLSCMFSKESKYTNSRYHSRFLWKLGMKPHMNQHVVAIQYN